MSNYQKDLFDDQTDLLTDVMDTMASSHTIDTITLTSPNHSFTLPGDTAMPTITISSLNTNSVLTNGTSGPFWANTISSTNPMSIDQTGTIELRGENADIKVNGESMMETLRGIQDRLNMLRPNLDLEAEWDQLRELGEQYRKLEVEFKEKSKMWETLKAMPAPEIT
jgi:hypothetical protein